MQADASTSSFVEFFRKSPTVREVSFAPGATVLSQGEQGHMVFVVLSGKLGIFRERAPTREMIAQRGPGHLVGEMALFGQRRRSASVIALEPCRLLKLEGKDVLDLVSREPALGIAISRLLAIRLQEWLDQGLEEKNRALEMKGLALEASHRELATILDHSIQGVVCLGSAGQIRYVNAPAVELLDLPRGANRRDQLPASLLRWLERGQPNSGRVSIEGRTLLVEVVRLTAGGTVLYLTPRREVGRMAFALSEIGARYTLDDILGTAPQIEALKEFVRKAAQTASNVLIEGEPGTGKALVAQAIHNASDRWHQPFVAIHCAAIPEELLESELFGHEKGAVAGAVSAQVGKLEAAQGGTLFLDEIAHLTPPLQARLLQAMQEGKVRRIGASHATDLDVRIISATNRDLEVAVESGSIREDLLDRLRVLLVRLPPLRQRASDIPQLVRFFLERLSQRHGKRVTGLSSRALSVLMHHDWPGNVRELENVLERAVGLAERQHETLQHIELLPQTAPEAKAPSVSTSVTSSGPETIVPLQKVEEQALRNALRISGADVDKAATGLGIPRATLLRKLKAHGIDRKV